MRVHLEIDSLNQYRATSLNVEELIEGLKTDPFLAERDLQCHSISVTAEGLSVDAVIKKGSRAGKLSLNAAVDKRVVAWRLSDESYTRQFFFESELPLACIKSAITQLESVLYVAKTDLVDEFKKSTHGAYSHNGSELRINYRDYQWDLMTGRSWWSTEDDRSQVGIEIWHVSPRWQNVIAKFKVEQGTPRQIVATSLDAMDRYITQLENGEYKRI